MAAARLSPKTWELVQAVCALPDHDARVARLEDEWGAAKGSGAADANAFNLAIAVVNQLHAAGADAPEQLRLSLSAVLSGVKAASDGASRAAFGGIPLTEAQLLAWGLDLQPPQATGASAAKPASPTSEETMAALRRYKRERLSRGALNITYSTGGAVIGSGTTTTYVPPRVGSIATWTVYDGGGAPFSAPAFAEKVGDKAMLKKLQADTEAFERTTGNLLRGGVALTVTSVVFMVAANHALNVDNEQGSAFAFGTGLVAGCVGTGLLVYGGVSRSAEKANGMPPKQVYVPNFYSPQEADAQIESYNDSLRRSLGLSAQDVRDIDLQSRRFKPSVHPWISVAGAGVSGTF